MNELVKYEKKFEVQMSKGDSFQLSEEQMNFFDKCFEERVMFKLKDGTRINPSFFISAKKFEGIPGFSSDEMKMLGERKKEFYQNTGRAPSEKNILEFIKKIKHYD